MECQVADCTSKGDHAGYCGKHYQRWKRHGDPLARVRIVGDDETRFWSYVQKTDDHWIWTGATSHDGYGVLRVNGSTAYAPRYAYELSVGPIPEGYEPDHLCRVRICVRPDHLEPVTHTENIRRGNSPQGFNYRKTQCIRGHEFTPENTYIYPSTGGRGCRQCIAMHAANRKARRATAHWEP